MKAEEMYLREELTTKEYNIVLQFLKDIGSLETRNPSKKQYYGLYGETLFEYFDLTKYFEINGVYFSKIAFMDGRGDLIMSLFDNNFNSVGGMNITQAYGIKGYDDEFEDEFYIR